MQSNLFQPSSDKGVWESLNFSKDSLTRDLYFLFQKALQSSNLLYPPEQSAWHYFQLLKDKPEIIPFKGLMQRNLAAALQDEAQQAINDYLKADPVELRNRWSYDSKYEHYPEYLMRASELLGPNHFYYKALKARQFYFEGLNIRLNSERQRTKEFLPSALMNQQKCLELETQAPFALNEIGLLFRRLGRHLEAIDHFQQALKLSPAWVLPWANLCGSYFEIDSFDLAEQAGKKAIELDSSFVLAYYNLALVYQYKQELEQAKRLFKTCIQLDPEYQTAYFKLAYINLTESNYELAEYYGLKLYQLDSLDKYNALNLAEAKAKQFKMADAELFYQKAYQLGKGDSSILMELSDFYFKQQKFNDSENYLQQVIKIDANHAAAYLLLSKTKAMLNNKKECYHYLNMALENGYRNLDIILKDPAFNKFSKKRSFKKILKPYSNLN